jgi:hypothetical protein
MTLGRPGGLLLAALVALVTTAADAGAQAPLIPGGLAALPGVYGLGPNLVQNDGFEGNDGTKPGDWLTDAAWAVDASAPRSGGWSLRLSDAPAVAFAQIARQPLTLRKGIYKLSGWIKTEDLGANTSGSGVRLNLDYSANGVLMRGLTPVVSGTSDWTYFETTNIVVPEDRAATLKLEAYKEPSGTAWFDDVRVEEQQPAPVEAFLLYPNYRGMLFEGQSSTIRIDVSVTPPGGQFSEYEVVVRLRDGADVTATRTYAASPALVAELDGSGMAGGRLYEVEVALVERAGGATLYAAPRYRVSRVAASARGAMNVAFDDRNRILLHGTPRFVLGVYDSGIGYGTTDAFWEQTLWAPMGSRWMDGLRINMYLNYQYGHATAAAMDALMANLQSHGVMFLQTGNCFQETPSSSAGFQIDVSDDYVRTLGAHAGSAGYYTADECTPRMIPGVFAQYGRLKALDADGMTLATLLASPPETFLWSDSADVLATDPYPLFGAEPPGGYLHRQVADWTAVAREAVLNARPFMTVLQFFKFTSSGRWPTLAEMRDHAYMAIVEGARGLFWWSLGGNGLQDVCPGWCDEKVGYMNNLKTVVGELADLEPALLADEMPSALTANSEPAAIRTKVTTVGGKEYLFAYNQTSSPVTPTFRWYRAPSTVVVNGEGRSLAAGGREFTDTFGPFQAHAYVIETSSLAVAFTSPPADATVAGTVQVSVVASGGSGSGHTYTIAVDGQTIFTGTDPGVAWNTTTVANGPHALTVTATDDGGGTATASRSVTVSNTASTPVAVNVAAASNGGVASASSTYSSAYPAAAAINGDRRGVNWGKGGGWNDATAGALPDWLQVTFGGTRTINEVNVFTVQDNFGSPVEPTTTLTFSRYGIRAFTVQYWTGTAWAAVPGGTVSGNTLVWRRFTFAPLTTDRIRILVTGVSASYARITEVEAWSTGGPSSGPAPNTPPTVALTAPADGTSVPAPASITLQANAADANGSVTRVEFFQGASKIGEASTAPYTLTWNNVGAGTYSLTARATDDAGAVTTSSAVTVTVTGGGAPVNVAASSNGGVASASSTYSSAYPVAAAINGDRRGVNWGKGGGWNDATAGALPDWLQVTFSGMKSISQIDVFTLQDNYTAPIEPTPTLTFTRYGITAFDVQYWTGTGWATVPGGAIRSNTSVWRRLTFTPVTTDRIRVLVSGVLASYSRIVELEAWGD